MEQQLLTVYRGLSWEKRKQLLQIAKVLISGD
jgi:hypothetical protein